MSRDALPDLPLERFSAAVAAIEKIATNNGQLLEHKLGTSAADVRAVVSYAQSAWYREGGRR